MDTEPKPAAIVFMTLGLALGTFVAIVLLGMLLWAGLQQVKPSVPTPGTVQPTATASDTPRPTPTREGTIPAEGETLSGTQVAGTALAHLTAIPSAVSYATVEAHLTAAYAAIPTLEAIQTNVAWENRATLVLTVTALSYLLDTPNAQMAEVDTIIATAKAYATQGKVESAREALGTANSLLDIAKTGLANVRGTATAVAP